MEFLDVFQNKYVIRNWSHLYTKYHHLFRTMNLKENFAGVFLTTFGCGHTSNMSVGICLHTEYNVSGSK
jgi:hypothetical protein